MQLDLERVKEIFYSYSGEEPEDTRREELCARLCEENLNWANELIEKREASCKEGSAKFEKYTSAVESWVAALAFYQLALLDEATAPKSLTADGINITEGERSMRAGALAAQKRMAILPIVGEGEFYFGKA